LERKLSVNNSPGRDCFNPLSLESVWRVCNEAPNSCGAGFNPLSLESVWRDERYGPMQSIEVVSIRFRWRVFGEAEILLILFLFFVSIRFRWRVFGELVL